ncbi:hypothetical protein CAEBREN_15624 [Caenorhabditis brenneri]|uniref:RING-type domain-containing protein n=1 Tax=Caenorhabditis brenneri TaxID=135651 RepID=G0N7X3_CAEBE|nr:hypothetical protein CAEBREN_15624 [Caenorhabditis brenneri]
MEVLVVLLLIAFDVGLLGLIIISFISWLGYMDDEEELVYMEAEQLPIPYIDEEVYQAIMNPNAIENYPEINEEEEELLNTQGGTIPNEVDLERLSDLEDRLLKIDIRRRRRSRCQPRKLTDQENPLKCKSCLKTFCQNPSDTPLLMQCGHTYCSLCIRTSPKFAPFRDMSKNMSYRTCPTCNKPSAFEHFDDLRMNHTLYSALSNITSTSSECFYTDPETDIDLKCTFCFDDLSCRVARKIPRVSPKCGHTKCEMCSMKMKSMRYRYATDPNISLFVCFVCNVRIPIHQSDWDAQVPINYAVQELLEYM